MADRGYSPRTARAYAFDLLAFARWLDGEQLPLAAVTTDVLLRFLAPALRMKSPDAGSASRPENRLTARSNEPHHALTRTGGTLQVQSSWLSVSIVPQFGKDYFGLDQSQVRLYTAILRHTVLAMAALAVCAVTAALARNQTDTQAPPPASPNDPPPQDPGLIPLTVNAVKRLFNLLSQQTAWRP